MTSDISLASDIFNSIRNVVGSGETPLHEPIFSSLEQQYVRDCIDSTYVSSVGDFVNRFEDAICSYTGAKYAVATVNGTAALHLGLLVAGIANGDEVLIPTLSFVATANAVTYCGAVPHFIDSDLLTMGVDVGKLRGYLQKITIVKNNQCLNKDSGRVIKAIVPMHTFGHPVNIDALLSLANEFNLLVVEDAAESLGSFYKESHTGTFGVLAALSFNGNKIITTGGGGAIITNNSQLAKRAKHLSTTAKIANQLAFEHDFIGYNYRMPNINAALGCAQIEKMSIFIDAKRKLAQLYKDSFAMVKGVEFFQEPTNCISNYWLNTILLNERNTGARDCILTKLNSKGIQARPSWRLLHSLSMFRGCPRMHDLEGSSFLEKAIINIPSSANITI